MNDLTAQLALCFDAATRITPAPRTGTLSERFDAWARANPHVVDAFEALALQQVRRGRKRVGAKAIIEVLRWHYSLAVNDPNGWKINNDMVSRIARLVADRNFELRAAFETRALKENAA